MRRDHRRALSLALPQVGEEVRAVTPEEQRRSRCLLQSRRALAAAGIEPGINPALESRKSLQGLAVGERQQLHQDHAGDVAGRIGRASCRERV